MVEELEVVAKVVVVQLVADQHQKLVAAHDQLVDAARSLLLLAVLLFAKP